MGAEHLNPVSSMSKLQQQKVAVIGVDPEAAQSYCSDM